MDQYLNSNTSTKLCFCQDCLGERCIPFNGSHIKICGSNNIRPIFVEGRKSIEKISMGKKTSCDGEICSWIDWFHTSINCCDFDSSRSGIGHL